MSQITVWHLGGGWPNLIVGEPKEPYLTLKPMCPRCLRPHDHEPTLVIAGTVGCLECFPGIAPELYKGKHEVAPVARFQLPNMSPEQIAHCTFAAIRSCDDEHLEWVSSLPGKDPLHFGEIKDRVELTLECTLVEEKGFDDYGPKRLVHWGPNIIWWTHEESCWPKVGETQTFKGTVVKHTWFQGVPQTVLSRCQLPRPKKAKVSDEY